MSSLIETTTQSTLSTMDLYGIWMKKEKSFTTSDSKSNAGKEIVHKIINAFVQYERSVRDLVNLTDKMTSRISDLREYADISLSDVTGNRSHRISDLRTTALELDMVCVKHDERSEAYNTLVDLFVALTEDASVLQYKLK